MAECLIKRRYNDGGNIPIVSWANGTPQEIAAMIAAADAGKINLGDYWSLGDKRIISHSAMPATNVGETHAAQSKAWVLMDTGAQSGYVFSDNTPVHYVVGMEDCFDETGYMNDSNINTGSWDRCARRKWCNNELRASFDEDTRALFKQFKTITASENNSDVLTTSIDYFALFAEKEVFGTNTYSRAAEANALTQIDYYKVTANYTKNIDGSVVVWWERSPYSNHTGYFCSVTRGGGKGYGTAGSERGLAPFGCI